jgi:hypothetical protein
MTDPSGRHEVTRLRNLISRLLTDSIDSAELVASPVDNPICAVQVDESIPCVTVVWKRYASSLQLRFVHEKVLGLLREHGLRAVLGDDKALPTLHPEDQRWILEDWLPRAKEAGLMAAASRRPISHWAQIAIDSLQSSLAEHVEVQSFDEWNQARDWLRSKTAVAR